MTERKVLVLDNGANTIKAGYALFSQQPKIIPNCRVTRGKGDKKTFIGDQFSSCTDFSGLYYRLPFEKGFLTNWEVEKGIWDRIFSKDVLDCDPQKTSLLITEPCFNLPNIQRTYDEMIFEVYEFQSYCRTIGNFFKILSINFFYENCPSALYPLLNFYIAPWLCIQNDISSLYPNRPQNLAEPPDCVLVVDSGYSFTHIVPFVMGRPILPAIRRINIGGKLLTNHLKEIVSFRYWDMMDQTYVMNEVKETCCYVSQDFLADLETCRKNTRDNPILQEYVLPDFSRNTKGYIREKKCVAEIYDQSDEQVLYMNNERFTVPEILFNPTDIGMNQAGIPEVIVEAINATHPDLHGLFYGNIVLVGGNSLFSGYKERVEKDLRVLAPSEFEVKVGIPEDPITYAWNGGRQFASTPEFDERLVTRSEYMEYGSNICLRKFGLGGDEIDEMSE
ncbi:actin-like protein arp6 [Gigaspora margarita]|uniref:Actin-like protein ARP6 n=1 Tax=Gigaspora margarita TaxID=4874 RepID=A0A8H3WXA7_GIGMA|nr:actin-like protein arp6 [Gigaspora margarita]